MVGAYEERTLCCGVCWVHVIMIGGKAPGCGQGCKRVRVIEGKTPGHVVDSDYVDCVLSDEGWWIAAVVVGGELSGYEDKKPDHEHCLDAVKWMPVHEMKKEWGAEHHFGAVGKMIGQKERVE